MSYHSIALKKKINQGDIGDPTQYANSSMALPIVMAGKTKQKPPNFKTRKPAAATYMTLTSS